MHRGFKVSIFIIVALFSSQGWAIQTQPTMDKRGLLGVVLDGQYFPSAEDPRTPVGARIAQIQPGLAADRANLMVGDIVLSVNDQDVSSVRELQVVISSEKPGSKVMLTVSRNAQMFMRSVVLGDWFDFLVNTPIFGPFANDVMLRSLTQQDRDGLRLPANVRGLYVQRVADGSLYSFVFREGMVITQVNGVDLSSPTSLNRLINEDKNVYQYYSNGVYGSFSLLKE